MLNLFDKNSPMHNPDLDKPIELNDSDIAAIQKTLTDISSAVSYFYVLSQNVSKRPIMLSDAQTQLSLLRYGYEDLTKQLRQEDFISAELAFTKSQLRQANREIRDLQNSIGANMSAEAGESFLRTMDNVITTWYITAGFHYAQMQTYPYGVSLDFSPELNNMDDYEEDQRPSLATEELYRPMRDVVQYQFGDDSKYLIFNQHSRRYLEDCDKNRRLLQELFRDHFPNGQIRYFKSQQSHDHGELSADIFVPYTDIAAILSKIKAAEATE